MTNATNTNKVGVTLYTSEEGSYAMRQFKTDITGGLDFTIELLRKYGYPIQVDRTGGHTHVYLPVDYNGNMTKYIFTTLLGRYRMDYNPLSMNFLAEVPLSDVKEVFELCCKAYNDGIDLVMSVVNCRVYIYFISSTVKKSTNPGYIWNLNKASRYIVDNGIDKNDLSDEAANWYNMNTFKKIRKVQSMYAPNCKPSMWKVYTLLNM